MATFLRVYLERPVLTLRCEATAQIIQQLNTVLKLSNRIARSQTSTFWSRLPASQQVAL